MATASQDAEAVLSGVSPEARNYALSNAPGDVLTSGEARRLTSAFLAANQGTANQVYGAQNVASVATAPVAKPDLSDPFGLYNYYMNTGDIVTAREAAKTAQAQLLERTKAAREQQTALGQNLQSTNRIRGSQAYAQELSTNDIQALNEAYTLAASNVDALTGEATNRYNIALQQRNDIKQLIAATGGKAGISYADSYESAVAKAKTYEDKVAKDAEKKAKKSAMADMYFQLTGKVAKSKWSSKELQKALTKAGASKKAIEDQIQQLEIASKKKSLASSGSSESDIKAANENFIFNSLSSAARGDDGFVDPSVWKSALSDWQNAGGSTADFISKFGGKVDNNGVRTGGFINPFDL